MQHSFWRLASGHPGFILTSLIYLTLALSYFFIVPIFEAPDEWTHTGHVQYIAEGHGLPVMLPGQGIWGGQQPPLYYTIGALLVQPFSLEGVQTYEERFRNPHASLGYALDPGNKNNYLHRPTENFPYRGLSLAVHLLRLYSITLGLITFTFTYLTTLDLANYFFSKRPHEASNYQSPITNLQLLITNYQLPITSPKYFATAAAFFIACQPMFAFITAAVANEPANMAGCAIALWLTQRYVLLGPSPRPYRAIALGLTLGLISLAKMTGLSFGLVAVVAFLQVAIATRHRPKAAAYLWRDGVIIALLFLLVGGWWYWRNYHLYGDFFQTGLYKIYFNDDPDPISLSHFLYILRNSEVSFWATFGWLNIVAPEWVYSVYRIISRVGLVGIAFLLSLRFIGWLAGWRIENRRWRIDASPGVAILYPPSSILYPLLIHLLFPLALAFSLTRLVAIEGGLQGRQLLPALGSIAILIVTGWWVLTPSRWRGPVLGLLATILLALALWLPYSLVAEAYLPPPALTESELPSDLSRLDWVYNEEIKLIGVTLGAEVVQPGQRVPVTAYWQALRPLERNYSVFVHLIGRGYENVGQFNTYPGLGLRPTSTLLPGQIIADTYPVLVNGGSEVPTRLLVNIGLFDFQEAGRPGILPTTSAGSVSSPTIGQLKLIPTQWPTIPDEPPLAQFADQIWLTAYHFEGCQTSTSPCQLTFEWLAQAPPAANYTVFIQLWPLTPAPEQFYGFDGPPLQNDYPTSLWASGEVIHDPHSLDLANVPPGTYQVLVGWYQPETGQRLAASTAGEALANQAVDLGRLSLK